MKIMIYNINASTGIKKGYYQFLTLCWRFLFFNRKVLNNICSLIKENNPDMVYLVETKKGTIRKEHDYIVKKTGYSYDCFFTIYKPALNVVPYIHNLGNSILSKHNFMGFKEKFHHGFLKDFYVKLNFENCKTTFYLLHLPLGKKTRTQQLKELQKAIKKNKGNSVVVGDFNTFRGPDELKSLLKECKLKNPNIKNNKTYPSWKPKKELDYILVSKNMRVKSFKILTSDLSDHLPLIIEIDDKK